YAQEEARTTGTIVDMYSNISAVKVYGREEDLKRAHRQIDAETRAFRALGWWDVIMFNYQGISIIVFCAGLVGLTGMLYGRGIVSVGSIVFIAAAAMRFINIIWEMGPNVASFIR